MPFGCGCARCAEANVRAAMACLPWSAATRAAAIFRDSLPGSFFKSSSPSPAMAIYSATSLRASCSPRACSSKLAFAPGLRVLRRTASPIRKIRLANAWLPHPSLGGDRFGGYPLRRAPDHPITPPSDGGTAISQRASLLLYPAAITVTYSPCKNTPSRSRTLKNATFNK